MKSVIRSRHLLTIFAIASSMVLLITIFSVVVGCGGSTSTVTVTTPPAQTQAPTTNNTGTQTTRTTGDLALGSNLTLTGKKQQQSSASPPYDMEVTTPVLSGSDDPRVDTFNRAASSIVQQQVSEFQAQAAQTYGDPSLATTNSTLNIDYQLESPPGQIISLTITSDIYYAGGAHPGQTIQSLNYDLSSGSMLQLTDLFVPGADYLGTLSTYCSQELTAMSELTFPEGVAPTPDNYQVWVLTSGGLKVIFNEYQVAPYAAGPQMVVVPYSYLQKILMPSGPASKIA